MAEATQLISTIKKQLKIQGMTYRDVARALKLSEPSVKRLFASGRFTLDRLVQVSNLLGYTLTELSKEAQAGQLRLSTLTEKQEREVVSDPKLLVIAVCALNHWTLDEIMTTYRVSRAECIKYLLRLDKLRIIDLLPGDFLKSNFARGDETMAFANGMLTDQALAQMRDELRRLRKKFAELHEESLAAPLDKRSGAGLLLAMRKWEPADFVKLRL